MKWILNVLLSRLKRKLTGIMICTLCCGRLKTSGPELCRVGLETAWGGEGYCRKLPGFTGSGMGWVAGFRQRIKSSIYQLIPSRNQMSECTSVILFSL